MKTDALAATAEQRRAIRELEDPFSESIVAILKMGSPLATGPNGTLMSASYVRKLTYPLIGGSTSLTQVAGDRTTKVFVPTFPGSPSMAVSGYLLACIKQNNRWFAMGLITS